MRGGPWAPGAKRGVNLHEEKENLKREWNSQKLGHEWKKAKGDTTASPCF